METRMVRVTDKPDMFRKAVAIGVVRMKRETVEMIERGELGKGDPVEVARIAGIMGAKRTGDLIPLCHPIKITHVNLELETDPLEGHVRIRAEVETVDKTGVEMEALTAVAVAALTVYDMCKGVDDTIRIAEIKLLEKEKHPS